MGILARPDPTRRLGAPAHRLVEALRPAGAQEHPSAGWDLAVREFPFADMRGGQEKIRIFLHVFRYVNDAGGADKLFRGDAVHGGVRQILAANPVHGCIEMRSSVLAGFEGVPIPEGTAAVVAGEFAEGKGRSVVPLWREREQGRWRGARQR